jgi:ABC-type branched-subunit amino acid transport system ATPase component
MTPDDRAPEVASLAATVLEEETRRRADSPDQRGERALDPGRELALELRGVDFSYGKVQVLFGVDLAVGRGETLALLGSNGAGKSTLLRVISGLNRPDRGTVMLNGVPITATIAEQRVRLGIVQLIGGEATFPSLTVVENLRAGAYRYPRREAKTRVERALEVFPMLADRRAAVAADLSGGQQHMLALAIALIHDPDVLLIDELSLGLAPVVVQQVLDVVRELKTRAMTMILVEQSVDVALGIADRAVVMEKGEIRFAGTAHELASRDDLVRTAFLGRDSA